MKLAGVEVTFLHIPDKSFNKTDLFYKLGRSEFDVVYAPAIEEGGNWIHNAGGECADKWLNNVIHYNTYVLGSDKTEGSRLIIPTKEEKELKRKMLKCYQSQLKIPTCAVFFNHPEVLEYESYE